MLNPQAKSELEKFTMIAKKIIYNGERMKHFAAMLGAPESAVTAVQSVISVIERRKPVPDELIPLLGVNIYMAMVDVLQEASKTERNPEGIKADPGVMKSVIGAILQKMKSSQPQQPTQPQPEQPAQPQGLLDQMQGAPA